jgi:hypothetical protein
LRRLDRSACWFYSNSGKQFSAGDGLCSYLSLGIQHRDQLHHRPLIVLTGDGVGGAALGIAEVLQLAYRFS